MSGPGESSGFEIMIEKPTPGLIRRFFTTQRHLVGLFLGALVAYVQGAKSKPGQRPPGYFMLRILAFFGKPLVKKELRDQAFPVQFRRRLEILGPTYIKLGQVLSLREDILPKSITEELKNLLDRLPIVRFPRYKQLLEEGLGRPARDMFLTIAETPVGSASIAQTHRATTIEGEKVIIKLVKPGIKKTLQRDAKLIALLGSVLQKIIPQYQPRKVLSEFTEYTPARGRSPARGR